MNISLPASQNQTAQNSKYRGQCQINAICDLVDKAPQALKETPEVCEETYFNTTNFHGFPVQLFKIFPPQLNDQTDSESIIIMSTLLVSTRITRWTHFMFKKIPLLKTSRMKSSRSSLKQNSTRSLELKSQRVTPS